MAELRVLYELLATHGEDPAQVVVGTETDRGLFVGALVAAGYQVYAINPLASAATATAIGIGAKSDAGDAKVLADLVRTDRHNHRPAAGDRELAEAVKVVARTQPSPVVAEAGGAAVAALVGVISTLNRQLEQISGPLERHPGPVQTAQRVEPGTTFNPERNV